MPLRYGGGTEHLVSECGRRAPQSAGRSLMEGKRRLALEERSVNSKEMWRAIEQGLEIEVTFKLSRILNHSNIDQYERDENGLAWDCTPQLVVAETGICVHSFGSKKSRSSAEGYAEGMLKLFRWLHERRMNGLSDPDAQIAFGMLEKKDR